MKDIKKTIENYVSEKGTCTLKGRKITDEMCLYAEEMKRQGASLAFIRSFFIDKFNVTVSRNSIDKRLKVRSKRKVLEVDMPTSKPYSTSEIQQKEPVDKLHTQNVNNLISDIINSDDNSEILAYHGEEKNELIQKIPHIMTKMRIQLEINEVLPLEERTYIDFETIKPSFISTDEEMNKKVIKLEKDIEYGRIQDFNNIDRTLWNHYLAKYERDYNIIDIILNENSDAFFNSFESIDRYFDKYGRDHYENKRPVHFNVLNKMANQELLRKKKLKEERTKRYE